jgi:hypothetical protein
LYVGPGRLYGGRRGWLRVNLFIFSGFTSSLSRGRPTDRLQGSLATVVATG